MRKTAVVASAILGLGVATLALSARADHVQPTCKDCPATYVGAEEIQAFLTHGGLDQQIRSVDAGKANVQIALVHRGPLAEPGNVAEHSLVSEVYYVISGAASHRTGTRFVDKTPRPSENYNVRMLNGPGHNATGLEDAEVQQFKAGDMIVIPAGTGHQFTRIDDHITYVMVRVDPDKVVPLMTEADARAYLAGKGPWAR
jgi:mannose-6-phosphate isomerase-like protein (cupin superfamily)